MTRRLVAVLVSIWFGGILLVALAAPASFRTVDPTLKSPPPAVEKVMKAVGPAAARDALRYQVSEVNRAMFNIWGWMQLGLGVVIFLLLLFMSTVGRLSLILALAMMLLSILMRFVLIPRISDITREIQTTGAAAAADKLQLLHGGYSVFQLSVMVLGSILLVLLLRSRGTHRVVKTRSIEVAGS